MIYIRVKFVTAIIYIAGFITSMCRFRYFYIISSLFSRLAPYGVNYSMNFKDGINYLFPLRNSYWNRCIFTHFQCEPEVFYLLLKLRGLNFSFLDLGATFGYWSLIASDPMIGAKYVLAIEPDSANYEVLKLNCKKNGNRFEFIRDFVNRHSGKSIFIEQNQESLLNDVDMIRENERGTGLYKIDFDDIMLRAQEKVKGISVIKLDANRIEFNNIINLIRDTEYPVVWVYKESKSDKIFRLSLHFLRSEYLVFAYIDNYFREIEDFHNIHKGWGGEFRENNFIAVPKKYSHLALTLS